MYWDDLTPEEQYADYLRECEELYVPAMSFEDWQKN